MMGKEDRILSALDVYDRFLKDLDTWFRAVRIKYGDRMVCGRGCARCCYGLFDVPLPDALRVAAGYRNLAPSVRNSVRERSLALNRQLTLEAPGLRDPFLLDSLPEGDVDRLTEMFDAVPCPFLGSGEECLIYASRPLACILEGVPMVDAHDGPFDDWCELNFAGGTGGEAGKDLVLDYYAIEATVQRTSIELLKSIPCFPGEETTVFLPSVVVAFESFWEKAASCFPFPVSH
jgi:Fe-S-cluster containining protein